MDIKKTKDVLFSGNTLKHLSEISYRFVTLYGVLWQATCKKSPKHSEFASEHEETVSGVHCQYLKKVWFGLGGPQISS